MIDPSIARVPSWWQGVMDAMRGIPPAVWLAIGFEESSLDPRKSNTVPPDDSWGLFQLNRAGGQGQGHAPAELQNPVTNAQIGSRAIRSAIAICGANDIVCIARNSGHPGYVAANDSRIQRIAATYRRIQNLDPVDAYAQLTGGQAPSEEPAPTEEPAPSVIQQIGAAIGSSIGPAVGGGIVTGAEEAIRGILAGAFKGGKDQLIASYSAPAVLGLGIITLSWGVTLAFLKSEPGQVAISVARTAASAAAEGAAVA
jgi:hypothetical protein